MAALASLLEGSLAIDSTTWNKNFAITTYTGNGTQ